MYQELLEKNMTHIENQKTFGNPSSKVGELVKLLNDKKVVMVSGLRNTGKTKLLHEMLTKTQSFKTTFYYNHELDSLGSIKTDTDIITIFDIFVRIHGVPKVIILQNTQAITHIKKFISRLIATKKYKVLLVGNNIKVEGIPEIECFPLMETPSSLNSFIYGGIPEVRIISDIDYKKFLLGVLKQDILTKDIFEPYNIKNISLYYSVLSYISTNTSYSSTREIHRQLGLHGIDISLLTLIDYLNAAVNTKLLKKCPLYDFKNSKIISSKSLYYFGDTGIRYSFSGNIPELVHNTLYLELSQRGYDVQGGQNGRFNFDLYAQNQELGNICLSIYMGSDKNEIRKTARKLAKIGDNSKKYIIVQNKNSLTMRKFLEDGVEIVELGDFLTKQ